MSTPTHLDRQFFALVWAVCNNSAAPEDYVELERRLVGNPVARHDYLRFIAMHGDLACDGSSPLSPDNRSKEPFEPEIATARAKIAPTHSIRAWHPRALLSTSVVAVLFYGVFASITWNLRPDPHTAAPEARFPTANGELRMPGSASVATLIEARNCVWQTSPGETHVEVGVRLRAEQTLNLVSGIAKLAFGGGAKVVLEGPTRFVVQESHRGRLEQGQLVARVPKEAVGFSIVTPTATIVDLGTEFGLKVDAQGVAEVHVFRGRVQVQDTLFADAAAEQRSGFAPIILSADASLRVESDGTGQALSTRDDFVILRKAIARDPAAANDSSGLRYILLGNLFDDPSGDSLVDAMRTDTYAAVLDTEDLGIETVIYGGDAVQPIAPGIRFDLHSIGWEGLHAYRAANDAIGDTGPSSSFPIRTFGARLPSDALTKIEEGIGMHANVLITFDLDEIRTAGRLEDRVLEFVCDRAGITDHIFGSQEASVHLAVLVSGRDGVQTAVVNGVSAELAKHDEIWSIASSLGEAIRSDGRFVNFRVEIPAEAKWLTLVTTSAANGHFMDGAVWSGARLNVLPVSAASQAAPGIAK